MKHLILILIPLLFLTSCTIDWNDEKDKKITELEKQIQEIKNDDSFKRNQECAQLRNEIEARIKSINYKNLQEDPDYEIYSFSEIFYSSEQNSCFTVIDWEKIELISSTGSLTQQKVLSHYLYKYGSDLTGITTESCIFWYGNDCTVFRETIRKMKGEPSRRDSRRNQK